MRNTDSIPRSGRSPLEVDMATQSNILAWRIPWTQEPSVLQSIGWQRDTTEATHTCYPSSGRSSNSPRLLLQARCWLTSGPILTLTTRFQSWRRERLPTPVSGLENSMDTVHGVTKSWTLLSDFHFPALGFSSFPNSHLLAQPLKHECAMFSWALYLHLFSLSDCIPLLKPKSSWLDLDIQMFQILPAWIFTY